MQITEKELELMICKNIYEQKYCDLIERGFDIIDNDNYEPRFVKVANQVQMGDYGIADILIYYYLPDSNTHHFTVVELKIEPLKPEHIEQVCRYHTALEIALKPLREKHSIAIDMVLIGSKNPLFYCTNSFLIRLGSFEYDLTGIKFNIDDSSGQTYIANSGFDYDKLKSIWWQK